MAHIDMAHIDMAHMPVSPRPFRCYPLIRSSPRRSLSSCPEKLLKMNSTCLSRPHHCATTTTSRGCARSHRPTAAPHSPSVADSLRAHFLKKRAVGRRRMSDANARRACFHRSADAAEVGRYYIVMAYIVMAYIVMPASIAALMAQRSAACSLANTSSIDSK